MRQDIFDAFWTVYEQEAWNRLNELTGSPDVTVNHVESFGLEAILSVHQFVHLLDLECIYSLSRNIITEKKI